MLTAIALIITGYLAGSMASAIVVCKIMRLGDPRSDGSGNPGATNVLRLYGKPAALLTLMGDVLKGVLPVLLAHAFKVSDLAVSLTALSAFAGHLYPVFFGFRGGKGVATYIGVLFGLQWLLGLAFAGIWLLTALVFRYSSLAALLAAALVPVCGAVLHTSNEYLAVITLMSILLFWRHRSNIRNLITGNEDKIGING